MYRDQQPTRASAAARAFAASRASAVATTLAASAARRNADGSVHQCVQQ